VALGSHCCRDGVVGVDVAVVGSRGKSSFCGSNK
jgi:hypothetical protein